MREDLTTMDMNINIRLDIVSTATTFLISYEVEWGTRWRNFLRHCATSRKFAGLIKSMGFPIDLILLAALWPGGRLSL
jgi:hypothetical protein